jgi:hypothetical protein
MEKEMSDARAPDNTYNNMYGPLMASLRNNLGLLTDELMKAKIALVRKITARIELATTPEEFQKLRVELSQAVLSDDDLTRIETTLNKFFDLAKKRVEVMGEIRNIGSK